MYVACVLVEEDGDFKTPVCTKTKRRHSEEQPTSCWKYYQSSSERELPLDALG